MSWRNYITAMGLGLVAGILAAIVLTACNPYATAWRTTAAVKGAGTVTDGAIAMAVRKAADDCIKAGETGEVKLPACVQRSKAWKAQVDWRRYGVPAINTAIAATVATLTIAEQTGQKGVRWLDSLKPAICGLARMLSQWGEYLGTARVPIAAAISAAKGITCQ